MKHANEVADHLERIEDETLGISAARGGDSMTAFDAVHDLRVSVIKVCSALRRLPGDGPREVAAVTLRAPLQQIETAARDIERWFNARSRCAAQEIRIVYPTEEGR